MVKSWDRVFQKVGRQSTTVTRIASATRSPCRCCSRGCRLTACPSCSATTPSKSRNATTRRGSRRARSNSKRRCAGSGPGSPYRTPPGVQGVTDNRSFESVAVVYPACLRRRRPPGQSSVPVMASSHGTSYRFCTARSHVLSAYSSALVRWLSPWAFRCRMWPINPRRMETLHDVAYARDRFSGC